MNASLGRSSDASINLMPPLHLERNNLPDLTKNRMYLNLRPNVSTPIDRIAEDVFVKVGTYQCRDLQVGDTKTFSYNIIESVNRVDVIDIACEEYVQEVLEISESGNPTSTSDLMIDSRSPSFTPFGGSDFLMEEIDEFLEHDDSIPPGVDGIYDSEGDTVYLEDLLSDAKPRLLSVDFAAQPRILMSLSVIKKGSRKSSAADHVTRLEKPHPSDDREKGITETFPPLETLGMVTFQYIADQVISDVFERGIEAFDILKARHNGLQPGDTTGAIIR
ncbi:hypothetical protein Tco_0495865 [Tanacetum coccineum]